MDYEKATQDIDFVQASVNMAPEEKRAAYEAALQELSAVITDDDNMIVRMATINCILKSKFSYYFWVGFYIKDKDRLSVGPYQGTLGCKYIPFGKGVCGTAYQEGKTQVVENVQAFPGHIGCDSRSQSEIVVPVFNAAGEKLAVFDVDSTELNSFDETDQEFLEKMMQQFFAVSKLELYYI